MAIQEQIQVASPPDYKVLTPIEFLDDFRTQATQAQQRVWARAMLFIPSNGGNIIAEALRDASLRDLDAQAVADAYSLAAFRGVEKLSPNLHFIPSEARAKALQERTAFFADMEGDGVNLQLVNQMGNLHKIWPIFGRDHSKSVVIDNICYMGGPNFSVAEFDRTDFMVKMTNPDITAEVAHHFQLAIGNRRFKDYSKAINPNFTFMADGGDMGRSLIYDDTAKAIAETQGRALYANPHLPGGKMLTALLNKADDGEHVDIVASNRGSRYYTKFPYTLYYNYMRRLFDKHPNVHFRHYPNEIHTKLITLNGTDAIFGSHNFLWFGVMLGTSEIAMYVKQRPEMVRDLENVVAFPENECPHLAAA